MGAPKPKVFKIRILTKDGNETVLVEAKSEARAVAHVNRKHLEVTLATHEDAVAHGALGGKIEEAIDE